MASGAPELIARLQEICGREHVLTHPHELATYRSDGLGQYQQNPSAVALPGGRLLVAGGLVAGSSTDQILIGPPARLRAAGVWRPAPGRS